MHPIDCHFHVGAWKKEEGLSSSLSDLASLIEGGCLGGAAVMTTDSLCNETLLEEVKKWGIETVYFFYWALPARPADIQFVRENSDVRGVKIHPSLARTPLTDSGYADILNVADARGIPVYVHCGRWREMSDYSFVLEAAGAYPNASFIVGHFGGKHPTTWKELTHDMARRRPTNVYIDISEMTEFRLLERATHKLGSGRLLMGSDYPFSHPAMYIALVNALDIGAREKEDILWRNMLKLLKADQ